MKPIKLAEGTIRPQELQSLARWLTEGGEPHLTQGEVVLDFERRFAEWIGRKHAIFVNSGSSANLLAYWVFLGAGRARSLRTVAAAPAVAWATSVMPPIQFGVHTHLIDAEERTWGMSPEALGTFCKRGRPDIVCVVPVLGVPVDYTAILDLQKTYGFLLLEDACGALGTSLAGHKLGTLGDISAFSFYYGHQASTIEGGMVVTDNDELARLARMCRAHGWAVDLSSVQRSKLEAESTDPFRNRFTFYESGFNLRGTDLQARLGLSQLAGLDEVTGRREVNHELYRTRLKCGPAVNGIAIQEYAGAVASISFGVLAKSKEHRSRMGEALTRAGIETRPIGGGNMARQPFFAGPFAHGLHDSAGVFTGVADAVHDRGFQLPVHPGLVADDIHRVCDVVLGVQ